jgi:hypothetical protein
MGVGLRRADDREPAVAGVHALGADRRAVRLGKPGRAQLAEVAAGLERVHQLADERRAPAPRAAAGVAGAGVHAKSGQKRCKIGHA